MSSDDYSRIYSGLQHRSRLIDVRWDHERLPVRFRHTNKQTSQQKLRRAIKNVSVSFCGSFGSFSSYWPSSLKSEVQSVWIFSPSTNSHVRSSGLSLWIVARTQRLLGSRTLSDRLPRVSSSVPLVFPSTVGWRKRERARDDERCDPAAGTFSVHPPSFLTSSSIIFANKNK